MIPAGWRARRRAVAWSRSPSRAPPSTAPTRVGIDADAVHRREVEHEAVVDAAEAGAVVAAAADGELEPLAAAEVDRGADVGDVAAADDQRRVLVDHRVVEPARLVVVRAAGLEHSTAETCPERLDRLHRRRHSVLPSSSRPPATAAILQGRCTGRIGGTGHRAPRARIWPDRATLVAGLQQAALRRCGRCRRS